MKTKSAEGVTDPAKNGDPEANGNSHAPFRTEERKSPAPEPTAKIAPTTPKRRLWPWLFIAALAAGGWFTRATWLPWLSPGSAGGPLAKAVRVIPVRTAVVQKRDLHLYINGLGTVTAFKTVTVKSRVDGEIINVAFTEGQMVKEGELLAEIDPRPFQAQLDQVEGTLAKDEAMLELAKLNLQRVRELAKSKSVAQQQVDEQIASVQQIEGTVQTDRGLVANARLQLLYCRIVAPVTGRIGLRLVDQGNIVHANDVMGMAVITQLQPIALVFPVSQDEIPRVQRETNAGETLTVFAYDRGFSTKLATGKLYAVDNQVDATTGTVRLKAVFENEDGMLFPNQFVNARLLVETKRDAVVVPAAAVQRGPNGTFVYVVKPDETVELQMVVTGETEGAEMSIATGLAPGDIVVTDGIDKLQNHAKVKTQEKEKEKEEATGQTPLKKASREGGK